MTAVFERLVYHCACLDDRDPAHPVLEVDALLRPGDADGPLLLPMADYKRMVGFDAALPTWPGSGPRAGPRSATASSTSCSPSGTAPATSPDLTPRSGPRQSSLEDVALHHHRSGRTVDRVTSSASSPADAPVDRPSPFEDVALHAVDGAAEALEVGDRRVEAVLVADRARGSSSPSGPRRSARRMFGTTSNCFTIS